MHTAPISLPENFLLGAELLTAPAAPLFIFGGVHTKTRLPLGCSWHTQKSGRDTRSSLFLLNMGLLQQTNFVLESPINLTKNFSELHRVFEHFLP